jgi:putative flippase GtrA
VAGSGRAVPRDLAGQAVRFLVVGAVATVADVALFNLLHGLAAADPFLAKSTSTLTGAVIAFVGNRQWSFAHGRGAELRHQVVRFVAVNIAALGVALLPIAVARSLLGLEGLLAMNVAANVVGLGLATCLRFYGYRRWVFAPVGRPPATHWTSSAGARGRLPTGGVSRRPGRPALGRRDRAR